MYRQQPKANDTTLCSVCVIVYWHRQCSRTNYWAGVPRQWIRVSFAKQAAYINPGLTISQHHHRFQKQNPIGQN